LKTDQILENNLPKKILSTRSFDTEGIGSLPIFRSGFTLLGIIVAWLLVAEIVARTPLGYFLPLPSVGADSFEFDTKVYYLEQSIRQRGSLDCLIVGDSMANDGPDPDLVEKAYQAETGSSLHCFNFGIPSLMLDALGPLTTALDHRFHPKLTIIVLSPRDFDPTYGATFRHVAFSDWTQQNLGETSLNGWAVNSLYGYRYALTFEYWLTPSNRENIINTPTTITNQGFTPLYGFGKAIEITGPGSKFNPDHATAVDGFNQLLQLSKDGSNLLIIDAPLRSDYYEAYETNMLSPYREYMQNSLDSIDIPFWVTGELSENIDLENWYDYQHLNENGVPIISQWLGKRLAEEYPPDFFK